MSLVKKAQAQICQARSLLSRKTKNLDTAATAGWVLWAKALSRISLEAHSRSVFPFPASRHMVGLFSHFVPHTTLFADSAYSIASQRKAKGHHFFLACFCFLYLQHNLSILVTAIPTLTHIRAPSKCRTSAWVLSTFPANPLNHVMMLVPRLHTRKQTHGGEIICHKAKSRKPGFTLKSE